LITYILESFQKRETICNKATLILLEIVQTMRETLDK